MSLVLYTLCSSSSRVALCKTPGCFLKSLSDPGTSYCRSFKQKKEELTSKLYQLYNTSVFDSKVSQTFTYYSLHVLYKCHLLCKYFAQSIFCDFQLPVNMSVTWNKKMRKTAGYCITGQERGGGNRYARIELSEKVCDSAGTAPLSSQIKVMDCSC